MTNAIEQTKRKMYTDLKRVGSMVGETHLFKMFEESLEAHLEELRKALVAGNAVIVDCAQHSAESFLALESRAARLTEERDTLRNRLQAFEFANKSAGEELRAANVLIRKQRETIGDLYMAKKARESQGSTSAQDSAENASETICAALPDACQHSFRYMHDFPSGTLQPRCIFCRKLLED